MEKELLARIQQELDTYIKLDILSNKLENLPKHWQFMLNEGRPVLLKEG